MLKLFYVSPKITGLLYVSPKITGLPQIHIPHISYIRPMEELTVPKSSIKSTLTYLKPIIIGPETPVKVKTK